METSRARVLTNGNKACNLVDEMRKAKRIRERLNLTLLDIHRKTGITPSHLNRFENGKRLMRYDALKTLSRFYSRRLGRKVSIDELLISDNGKEPA